MGSCLCSAAVAVLVFTSGGAQTAPNPLGVDFERLIRREVRVVDARGVERQGKLIDATTGELRIMVGGGEITAPLDHVRRLDRRDSLTNGVIIGMLWPAVTLPLGGAQGLDSDDSLWLAIPMSILVGGAIGAGIDALNKGWTTVYRSDGRRQPAFHIMPSRRGVRVSYVKRF